MGKKGLSFEEKRARMLEFFYEKKEVLTLKELEKVMPKLKGIVMQSVKEVLQSLVDDNLVDHDKIGAGNFYWALPSSAVVKVSLGSFEVEVFDDHGTHRGRCRGLI